MNLNELQTEDGLNIRHERALTLRLHLGFYLYCSRRATLTALCKSSSDILKQRVGIDDKVNLLSKCLRYSAMALFSRITNVSSSQSVDIHLR